jgi:cell division septum initiation protein DivIVA
MTELRVSHLIDEADELLDNKFHVGSYCLFMNTDDIQDILSKIRAILPEEIKTAEMILKRRDDIYMEAQSKADRILSEAKNTADKLLSENELMRLVREKAMKFQEQVKESCEEMKNKAEAEAEAVRKSAYKEASETREGAKAFAEEMLMNLERDIDRVHRHVRNCQDMLNQKKEQRVRAPQQDNGNMQNRVNAEQK